MARVREILWRKVTDGDFFCVERSRAHTPAGGGGQTYFSLSFGSALDKRAFGEFLGVVPPTAIETEKPAKTIEAGVLTDPTSREALEFSPRYQNDTDDRYRIANQNRQRSNQVRHPAWRAERGFPRAPDDVASKEDPRMPDLSYLKLIVARCDDGSYLADFTDAGVAPPGSPLALAPLFRANADSAADGLIAIEPAIEDVELAAIVARSHAGSTQGLPSSPEIEDARDSTARAAGRRLRGGQGFRQSSQERIAIDRHAMAVATQHLEADGWRVEDKSVNHPYDLLCRRSGETLHVEVKGTTSDGRAVLLTPNEVSHARAQFPDVALLVVHGVELSAGPDGEPAASGGSVDLTLPWEIDAAGSLEPTGYSYVRGLNPG